MSAPSTPMRDPNRINRIIELLREAWHLQPDFRLTQLVMVASGKSDDLGAVWHVEDDSMEKRLRGFIGGIKRFGRESPAPPSD
jgi:streptomycin 6-kinase